MTRVALLVGALAAVLVGATGAGATDSAYRNTTVGRGLSPQIPGMHRVSVRRGLVYRRVGREVLRADVYRPRGGGSRVLPVVLVGGPPAFRAGRTSSHKVGWRRATAARRPKPLPFGHRCVTALERRRVVRFSASDATRLIGVTFGSGPRGVVLAHQGGPTPPNLCSWVPYARQLAAAGYRVLAFDHRRFGHSESARRARNFTRVDLDALAATRELRRRGVRSVVLVGASLGGSAVIAAGASARPAVQGVVSFGAPRRFGRVDALAAARRLTVPVLFVATVEDEPFATDARALYEASAAADKRVEIFPGFEHGAPMLRHPAVRTLVDGWIGAHSISAS